MAGAALQLYLSLAAKENMEGNVAQPWATRRYLPMLRYLLHEAEQNVHHFVSLYLVLKQLVIDVRDHQSDAPSLRDRGAGEQQGRRQHHGADEDEDIAAEAREPV